MIDTFKTHIKNSIYKFDLGVVDERKVKDFNERIAQPFLEELRKLGVLKDFREDYNEMTVSTGSGSSLDRISTEVTPKQATVFKNVMDNFFGFKNK